VVSASPGALFALALALAPAAPARHSAAPPAPAVAPADTGESAPAPLLVPGRPPAPDTAAESRLARARKQYELGRTFESAGGRAPAIAAYRNAVYLDPTIEDANYRMGRLFLTVGQVGEAVRCFAAEVEHHPGRADAARELGLGLARLGEHARAIAQLELLTQRRPDDGESWRALGFAYSAAGRPRDAEAALRRAIALPPDDAGEHRDLGALLAGRGRIDEARTEYRRAMAIDPKDAAVWVNLANLERRLQRAEPALADYREAERRDSTLSLAMQGEIQTLRDLGRNAEAGAVYRRLLAIHPEDLASRLDAVRLFDGLGRKDIALELARDGVRHDHASGDAHLLLGMALQASGDTRTALTEMRTGEALFRDPTGRGRAGALIASLRAEAPDSLRALFTADSVAHPRRAPRRPTPVLGSAPR
jgi:tetratricopeptide (TPR) repeat protein